jgi:hypothetical protein
MNLRLSIGAIRLFFLWPPLARDMSMFRLLNIHRHLIQTQGSWTFNAAADLLNRSHASLPGFGTTVFLSGFAARPESTFAE